MSFFYSCMSDLLDICTTIAFKDFFSQEEKRKLILREESTTKKRKLQSLCDMKNCLGFVKHV